MPCRCLFFLVFLLRKRSISCGNLQRQTPGVWKEDAFPCPPGRVPDRTCWEKAALPGGLGSSQEDHLSALALASCFRVAGAGQRRLSRLSWKAVAVELCQGWPGLWFPGESPRPKLTRHTPEGTAHFPDAGRHCPPPPAGPSQDQAAQPGWGRSSGSRCHDVPRQVGGGNSTQHNRCLNPCSGWYQFP